jgi:hypothetical protein
MLHNLLLTAIGHIYWKATGQSLWSHPHGSASQDTEQGKQQKVDLAKGSVTNRESPAHSSKPPFSLALLDWGTLRKMYILYFSGQHCLPWGFSPEDHDFHQNGHHLETGLNAKGKM